MTRLSRPWATLCKLRSDLSVRYRIRTWNRLVANPACYQWVTTPQLCVEFVIYWPLFLCLGSLYNLKYETTYVRTRRTDLFTMFGGVFLSIHWPFTILHRLSAIPAHIRWNDDTILRCKESETGWRVEICVEGRIGGQNISTTCLSLTLRLRWLRMTLTPADELLLVEETAVSLGRSW